MKKILFTAIVGAIPVMPFCFCENLFAETNEWKIELVRSTDSAIVQLGHSRPAPYFAYKTNLKTGESIRALDLQGVGIYRSGEYRYDETKDVLIVHDLGNTTQYIKVVDLKNRKVMKSIEILTSEPELNMRINSSNGVLYVSFWDEGAKAWATSIFGKDYEPLMKIKKFTVSGYNPWSSSDNQLDYLLGGDRMLMIDLANKIVVAEKNMRDLAIKREYARIRDCKKGVLLLEYRSKNSNNEDVETYLLYDPQKEKIVSPKIANVPYHIGGVYLDDSLNGFVINEAKSVSIGGKRAERKYTGKVKVYNFAKQKMTKEIDIGEGAGLETIENGTIYYRQDNKVKKVEYLK